MDKMQMLKKLRDELGAGVVDCQNAIKESNGDYEIARDILRKKGLANAQKKASRVVGEGLVSFYNNENSYSVIELNCETDFVARNEKFSTLLKSVAEYVNSKFFASAEIANNDENVKNMITSAIGSIGENITLSFNLSNKIANDQFVASYVHNASVNEVNFKAGKIIVTAVFEGCDDSIRENADFRSIASQISMHIAATNPISLNIESVDQTLLAREKAIYEEQSASSGKPAQVIEKMVEGKIKKFLEENVLLEQILVTDGKTKVSELVTTFNKTNSSNVKLVSFGRFVLGQNVKQ